MDLILNRASHIARTAFLESWKMKTKIGRFSPLSTPMTMGQAFGSLRSQLKSTIAFEELIN